MFAVQPDKRAGIGVAAAVIASALAYCGAAKAGEGGANQYFSGATNIMSGVGLPEGDHFLSFTSVYSSNQITDANGDDRRLSFHLTTVMESLAYVHRSGLTVLGGEWGFYVIVPLVHADAQLGNRKETRNGVGDIVIAPASFAWHAGDFHWIAGLQIYLPTGNYDRRNLANISRNYYGFMPNFSFTYLSEGGFEVSSRLMYAVNSTNEATRYHSGDEFLIDSFVGYHVGGWVGGLAGYGVVQTVNDTFRGVTVPNSAGRALGLGLAVSHELAGIQFTGSITRDVLAINRQVADRFGLRAKISF